jgi:hypothetical protein
MIYFIGNHLKGWISVKIAGYFLSGSRHHSLFQKTTLPNVYTKGIFPIAIGVTEI